MNPFITTHTGVAFDLLAPAPDMVRLEDIAHALAHLCRFTGHCQTHYSVAQHCVLVARGLPAELRAAGLLHDAAEAYIGDWSTPLKRALAVTSAKAIEALRDIETGIEIAICLRFGVDPALLHDPRVKHQDRVMYVTEKRDLMPEDARTDLVFGDRPDPHKWMIGALGPARARESYLWACELAGIQ